jgi:hypothetical protein
VPYTSILCSMLDLNSVPRMSTKRYSQAGEDVLVKAFIEVAELVDPVFCEFGAHSGQNSNLLRFCEDQVGELFFIECDQERAQILRSVFGRMPRLTIIEEKVGWSGEQHLRNIFSRLNYSVDKVQIWSIDIDGDDYHVFQSLPGDGALVVIEFNPTFSFDSLFINPPGSKIGSSPRALVELARQKNYFLAAATETNLVFIHSRFQERVRKYDLLELEPHPDSIRLALGYDGTVVAVSGAGVNLTDEIIGLGWSNAFFVQPLPRFLRRFNSRDSLKSLFAFLQMMLVRPSALIVFCRKALRARAATKKT